MAPQEPQAYLPPRSWFLIPFSNLQKPQAPLRNADPRTDAVNKSHETQTPCNAKMQGRAQKKKHHNPKPPMIGCVKRTQEATR